jgi:hypothetical protein
MQETGLSNVVMKQILSMQNHKNRQIILMLRHLNPGQRISARLLLRYLSFDLSSPPHFLCQFLFLTAMLFNSGDGRKFADKDAIFITFMNEKMVDKLEYFLFL